MEVIVYTTPTCPWCKVVKDYLKSNNITYIEHDVSKDDKATTEMINKSGQMGVPVVDIDGEIIIGFDQDRIDRVLGL
ncbi:glutaredoxin family protein [Clostridium malenominatum]|uniref:Glutaredoxin family protein n=1 Tax=Clostridium malenominatum TaxID=1539 RepID=A0ABP3U5T2_9CLOT